MYGSTIFIIMITGDRVHDRRLWYAPWLFPGQHAAMAGLATSGTLTHWFRDAARARPRPGDGVRALAAEAEAVAAGRQGPRLPALFLRRADADPRSPCQRRAVRPQPHSYPRRHLSRLARRHRLRHQSHLRDLLRGGAGPRSDLSPSAAAPGTGSGRRRRPTSRAARRSSATRRSAPPMAMPSSRRWRSATSRETMDVEPGRDRARAQCGQRRGLSTDVRVSELYSRTKDLMRNSDEIQVDGCTDRAAIRGNAPSQKVFLRARHRSDVTRGGDTPGVQRGKGDPLTRF